MAESDGIDAIYVATPTSVREEICLAAAQNGKHVLAEKPFASLSSLQRIVEACRENNVGFMDGTHFVHNERHDSVKADLFSVVGSPRKMISYFQIAGPSEDDIRSQPDLEPMGALGDIGWYIMRAAAEYIPDSAVLTSSACRIQRDSATGAVVEAHGIHDFSDESALVWSCGYRMVAGSADLRILGPAGSIFLDRFISNSTDYVERRFGDSFDRAPRTIQVNSPIPHTRLMFEDFAAITVDPLLRPDWSRSAVRTQLLLDAAFESANPGRTVGG